MNLRQHLNDRWVAVSVGLTAGVAAASIILGFILLPLMQSYTNYAGLWDAICGAAGLLYRAPATEPVVQPAQRGTQVVLTPTMLEPADADSVGRGATLSLRCTMCHGARGLSEAGSPNLAGQYPFYIYKELKDIQSGARPSAVMYPLVTNLSDQDMRDLAAFYAYLPRLPGYHPAPPRPRIVVSGAPMRGIAPCGACHGALDYKIGSAWLEGQPESYLLTQLEAFASGARHNDVGGQMRVIARNMSPEEIREAAAYYAQTPP
jgi:cytochrome c553